MAKPTVTQPTTPRTVAQGIAIPTLTLVATGSPTSWSAAPLPAGLTLDDEAGTISGTPTAEGLTSTTITATNGDGTSDAVAMVWNVQAQPAGAGNWDDLEVDFDLVERSVTIPGVTRETGSPIFRIARGDKMNLLVGLVKFGVLRDVQPGAETVGLRLALKEFEPEIVLTLAGGEPTKVGSGDTARFRIPVRLAPEEWAVLADYEADAKTGLTSRAELELTVGDAPNLYDETESETGIDLYGGIGAAELTKTLVFTGLTETTGASYDLALALVVTDRAGQNVSLAMALTLTFTGGVWVISDLTGTDTVQGPAEGSQWRVTMEATGITGDADSVDVAMELRTTEDALTPAHVVLSGPFSQMTPGEEESLSVDGTYILELWNGPEESMDTQFGTGWDAASGSPYASPAAFAAELELAWEMASGVSDVASVTWTLDPPVFTVNLEAGSPVSHIRWAATPSIFTEVTAASTEGTHRTAVLTGQLQQASSATEHPIRYSAQFPVEVIRDIVPDNA